MLTLSPGTMMKSEWKAFLAAAGAEQETGQPAHFGNARREQEVALSGMVFADLDYLGVIGAHGPDAASFLHAQLSNDIQSLDPGSSRLAALCTPKGRMLGLARLLRSDDGIYLRLPADTLETVLQRLRMYVLRARVSLEDVSENFIRIGVSGHESPDEIRKAAGHCPEVVNNVTRGGGLTVVRVPGVMPRFEIYIASLERARDFWDAMNVRGAPVGEAAWRLLEIMAGLPAVFAATVEQFVPQMANLQLLDGVSFRKGCYPGQEIVARMQYLGTLKRRMYLGRIDHDAPVAPGSALYSGSDPDQAIGQIVDAQPHPDGGLLALAVLRIESAELNDVFLHSPAGPAFELQKLPYPFPVE